MSLRISCGVAAALVLVVGGCQCGEGLDRLEADIDVEPRAIDLGEAIVGAPTTATFHIGNRGNGRLDVEASIDPEGQAFRLLSAPEIVRPGEAEQGRLEFLPGARVPYTAELVLRSNDADEPELRIPLSGAGGPPELRITPDPVDLGLVNEGVGASAPVTLSNVGFDTLSLQSVGFADDVGFVVDAPGVPGVVAPGEAITVTVSLAPSGAMPIVDGVLRDKLVVTHADGSGEADVLADVNLAPVATVVEKLTRREEVTASVGQVVIADGSETYDPDGDAFSFQWSVAVRPATSIAAVIGTGPQVQILPDVVGSYAVRLRAIDVRGAFREDDLLIHPRDLSIVLTWTASASAPCRALSDEQCAALDPVLREQQCCGQSDLDLHVVGPGLDGNGGALGDYGTCPAACDPLQCQERVDDNAASCRQLGTDCAYANRAPEWGEPGRADDPRLDVDDVRGAGPEITSLDSPADGVYRVVVHYCEDRIGEPTLATIDVVDHGTLLHRTEPQAIEAGEAWIAATLIRAGGAWQVVAPPGVFDDGVPADLCTR